MRAPFGLRETKLGRPTSGVHGRAKLAYRVREPDEYRATHDRVSDVELFHFWDRRDGSDVLHGESVAGMHR